MKVTRGAFAFYLLLFVPNYVISTEFRLQHPWNSQSSPFASHKLPPGLLSLSLKECDERPEIPHAKVACGYSGCSVKCEDGHKMASGLGDIALQCDHSSGNLTLEGQQWQAHHVACLPWCGISGCQNGGKCNPAQQCDCHPNYSGEHCEIPLDNPNLTSPDLTNYPTLDPDTCPDPEFPVVNAEVTREGQRLLVRCKEGHEFKIGGTIAFIECRGGVWDHPRGVFSYGSALVCEEKQCRPPCHNGGTCLPGGFCACPYKYWGATCRNLRCAFPPASALAHASLGGVSSRMKIQCHPGYKMLTNKRTQTILCRNGHWFVPRHGLLDENDVKCYTETIEMPTIPQQ